MPNIKQVNVDGTIYDVWNTVIVNYGTASATVWNTIKTAYDAGKNVLLRVSDTQSSTLYFRHYYPLVTYAKFSSTSEIFEFRSVGTSSSIRYTLSKSGSSYSWSNGILNLAPLDSPTFTGTPQITSTPAVDDNSHKIADTAFVKRAIDNIPEITVDTELSDTSENPVQNKAIKAGIDAEAERATEAEQALDTEISGIEESLLVENSKSGAFITVEDAAPVTAKKLTLTLEHYQDLHGYANPWPEGGGKNLLPLTISKLKEVNTSGTWTGNVYAINGVTFSVLTDNGGNVIGVNVNGTASSTAILSLGELDIPNGTYYANGVPSGAAINTYSSLYTIYDGSTWVDSYCLGASTFTVTNDKIRAYICRVNTGATVTNQVFYPMVRLSTESDSTFAPYSNICPIEGWTGVNIGHTAKNMFDENAYQNLATDYEYVSPNQNYYCKEISLAPYTEYTISQRASATSGVILVINNVPEVNQAGYFDTRTAGGTKTFTTDGTGKLYIGVYKTTTDANANARLAECKIQIEAGSTATAYEAYQGGVLNVDWTDEAGTVYGGMLDVTTGVLTVDRKSKTFTSSASGYVRNDMYIATALFDDAKPVANNEVLDRLISDTVIATTLNNIYGGISGGVTTLADGTGAMAIMGIATREDFNTYIAAHSIQVVYPIATPITYQLTPAQLQMLKGLNYIWTDADGMELEYSKLPIDPDLEVVGNAKQLLSDVKTIDREPYLFRASEGNGADREYDTLVGGTVAWNQLVGDIAFNVNFPYRGITATISADNHSVSFSGTCTQTIRISLSVGSNLPYKKGHKCVFLCGADLSQYNAYIFFETTDNRATKDSIVEIQSDVDAPNGLGIYIGSGATVDGLTITPQFFDLTKDFGSTIADYAYSLEQATAGSGIAWLKKYGFFTKPYYPYNAGELMSVKTTRHKMVGFNQFDEQWPIVTSNYTRGTKIKVLPNTRFYGSYFGIRGTGIQTYWAEYDENDTMLAAHGISVLDVDGNTFINFETSSKVSYIMPQINFSGTAPSGFKSCLSLYDSAKNGTYEPYKSHSYALGSDELRGLFKLDANNNLYAEGDTKTSDGTITRKYGLVDLGTLTWTYSSTAKKFYATLNGQKSVASSAVGNIVCDSYVAATAENLNNSAYDHCCATLNGNEVQIKNLAYTDVATFKAAMSGQYLVYELATPTTETAEPFQNPQIVDPNGTEEYIDDREVAIPVGHYTEYPANLRAEIERVMQQIPDAPGIDGTYVLKVTVSGGVASYSWVAQ